VNEYTSPVLAEPATTGNLTDMLVLNAAEAPHRVAFRRRSGSTWVDVTTAEFLSEVQGVAKGLVASGVQIGDRVGLMAKTRYEWTLIDYAIWAAGAVTVPIYETSSAEQVQWILGDSGAVAVFAESPANVATVEEVRGTLGSLEHVWCIDTGAVEELTASGASVSDEDLEARRTTAKPSDLATIIYTSGTTGRPKGCELTHGNFLFEAANVVSIRDRDATLANLFSDENASTLLFLPLAHVFARMIQVGVVMGGSVLGHTSDVKTLMADLATFQPTFILSVPRVFEKVYNSSEQKAEAAGKGKIFHAAATTAIAWSEAQDHGGASIGLKAKHALFDKLVYSKLRAALGGRVRFAVSGGAPLGHRLGHFFRGVGLTVLEGYGLTETTAASTVNTPGMTKIGTVGRPLPGVSVRIAEDGEVLVKGGQVFIGYFNNPDATAEALRAVPLTIREAGYGVGASRWEVTRKLVLPAALPGILTGTVLALARALGETAPLLLIGGIVGGFSTPEGQSIAETLLGSYTALPLTVFQWAKQPQEEFRQLAAAAIVVLLAVTLFANGVAVLLRNRFERSW